MKFLKFSDLRRRGPVKADHKELGRAAFGRISIHNNSSEFAGKKSITLKLTESKINKATSPPKFVMVFSCNFDNKKPEELESEFVHFDIDNSYPSSPFKDRNIVDLDFVYKQLLDGRKT